MKYIKFKLSEHKVDIDKINHCLPQFIIKFKTLFKTNNLWK